MQFLESLRRQPQHSMGAARRGGGARPTLGHSLLGMLLMFRPRDNEAIGYMRLENDPDCVRLSLIRFVSGKRGRPFTIASPLRP